MPPGTTAPAGAPSRTPPAAPLPRAPLHPFGCPSNGVRFSRGGGGGAGGVGGDSCVAQQRRRPPLPAATARCGRPGDVARPQLASPPALAAAVVTNGGRSRPGQPQLLRRGRRGATAAATAGAAASGCSCGAAGAGAAAAAPAAAAAAAAASSSPLMDLFAVVLGYACLAGSLFRSVPQIAVILRTGSAEGLSLTSNLMELLCFTVTVAYNIQQGYAFNTYGEVFACWIQDVIIVGLIFRHMRLAGGVVAAATAAFAAACVWLFSPACPMEVLSALQLSTIAVMAVGARLPQIWLNVRRGNAGVLSPLTCGLNVAGCCVRVFTTAVLTRDPIIMGGCVTQLILNAVLLYQSVATPGLPAASSATSSAAAVAVNAVGATDPPTGGAWEARGQPTVLAAAGPDSGDGDGDGGGGGGAAGRQAAASVTSGKAGDAGAGGGGGGGGGGGASPVPVPAAA